jgi:hypothetical protein
MLFLERATVREWEAGKYLVRAAELSFKSRSNRCSRNFWRIYSIYICMCVCVLLKRQGPFLSHPFSHFLLDRKRVLESICALIHLHFLVFLHLELNNSWPSDRRSPVSVQEPTKNDKNYCKAQMLICRNKKRLPFQFRFSLPRLSLYTGSPADLESEDG